MSQMYKVFFHPIILQGILRRNGSNERTERRPNVGRAGAAGR